MYPALLLNLRLLNKVLPHLFALVYQNILHIQDTKRLFADDNHIHGTLKLYVILKGMKPQVLSKISFVRMFYFCKKIRIGWNKLKTSFITQPWSGNSVSSVDPHMILYNSFYYLRIIYQMFI